MSDSPKSVDDRVKALEAKIHEMELAALDAGAGLLASNTPYSEEAVIYTGGGSGSSFKHIWEGAQNDSNHLERFYVRVPDRSFYRGGSWVTPTNGVGVTYASGWMYATFTAEGYFWVEYDRSANTVTMKVGATPSSGTDTLEVYPIWYVAWDGTNSKVDFTNCIALWPAIHESLFS